MGTVVEALAKETGLIWPKSIAPFTVHLVRLSDEDELTRVEAEEIYNELIKRGVEVLFDDRQLSTGEKLADADLLGLPLRVIVSKRNREAGKLEVVDVLKGETKTVTRDELYELV
jgi:prolyl-tRNA synthetase